MTDPLDRPVEPDWFRDAIGVEPEDRFLDVDGVPIHALLWGGDSGTPLLLVHGNGAHARWWSFIAPELARSRRVAAIDLGGMGDSGARDDYTPGGFGREIEAYARLLASETGAPKVDVAAHSFGGLAATYWAGESPSLLGRLVLLDVPFVDDGFAPSGRSKSASSRIHPRFEDALSRFRLLPPQPCDNPFLVDYIARHSIVAKDGGWAWKFKANPWDHRGFQGDFWTRLAEAAGRIRVPVTMVRGEMSALCPTGMEARWRDLFAPPLDIRVLADARHHLMLDRPLDLIAMLDDILASDRPH